MPISWIRKVVIYYHFSHLSFRQKTPSKGIFTQLSSEELHYLAAIHNWDDGPTLMHWIVLHPRCDLGTAIMIFWLAQPDHYFKFQSPPRDDFDLEIWELLQIILKRINEGIYQSKRQSFTPSQEDLECALKSAGGIWELPPVLQTGLN